MRTFTTFDELTDAIGADLGTTDWFEITQDRVDAFADATGDHQWIHVDVERVKDGSRIRATAQVAEVSDVPAGKQLVTRYTIEIEGESKPACVAETVVLLLN